MLYLEPAVLHIVHCDHVHYLKPVSFLFLLISLTHNPGEMYHKALRKHGTFLKSFQDLDVAECMDNLRSDNHATDEDVDKVEAIDYSDNSATKTAMKILYAKLTKLSDEGLRYFVEDVLPEHENTEVLQGTFRYCPGQGKCPLKPGQGHVSALDTAARNVTPVRDVIGYFSRR